jgi:hypothetical protein
LTKKKYGKWSEESLAIYTVFTNARGIMAGLHALSSGRTDRRTYK